MILETKNAGATWQSRGTSMKEFIRAVALSPNNEDAIAVGGDGLVLLTEDRGISWHVRDSGGRQICPQLRSPQMGGQGLLPGDEDDPKTVDAGATWKAVKRTERASGPLQYPRMVSVR